VITNTIALNASNSKNQQFHVEFCYLINVFWTLWIKTKKKFDRMKTIPKKGWYKYNFKDKLYWETKKILEP
jgi:hypothetical protein